MCTRVQPAHTKVVMVCVYVCVHACVCICVHPHWCMFVYAMPVSACQMYTFVCTRVGGHVYVCVHMWCTRVGGHVYVCVHMWCTRAGGHVYVCVHMWCTLLWLFLIS